MIAVSVGFASGLCPFLVVGGLAVCLACGEDASHLVAGGFEVDAVDLSPVVVAWSEDRAHEAGVDIRFLCGDAFALPATELSGPYDLVVDSGCFHHLPPHRRVSYLTARARLTDGT